MAESSGFHLTADEKTALDRACIKWNWLQEVYGDDAYFHEQVDRKNFNDLAQSAKTMRAALRGLGFEGEELPRKFSTSKFLMQLQQSVTKSQVDLFKTIVNLGDFLELMEASARLHARGRGMEADEAVQAWIECCAASWRAVLKLEPGFSENSRFTKALLDFQDQIESSQTPPPSVTERAIRTAGKRAAASGDANK